MTDRILLTNLVVSGRHGVEPHERVEPQRFAIDVELRLDLRPAGTTDDLGQTADYAAVDRTVRRIVETTSFQLIEALAERIASTLLSEQPRVESVTVRVRKPDIRLAGPSDPPGIEISRDRAGVAGSSG